MLTFFCHSNSKFGPTIFYKPRYIFENKKKKTSFDDCTKISIYYVK